MSLDSYLILRYREMCGLDNISTISFDTLLKRNVSLLSTLNICNNFVNSNNISLLSNLNVNNLIQNLNLTINSNLNINNESLLSNNITLLSNLECNNITVYNKLNTQTDTLLNNITIMSKLHINSNIINKDILLTDIRSYNTSLSLLNNIINIGTTNSKINIMGTSLYVASSELKINDKIISLNIDSIEFTGFDKGDLSGIEIMGTNNNGFIKSNDLGTLITIKPPLSIEQNILTLSNNNNMNITGYNILNDNVNLYKSLNIKNNIYLKNVSIGSKLQINNNGLINNLTTNSNLYISGNSILNNITINSIFINNNLTFNNNISILSELNVNSNMLSNNLYTSNLSVLNNTILNYGTVVSNLNINNNSYFNNISCLSNLNINNISILNDNTTLLSNLNINNNLIINGNNTIGSNLIVKNNMIFNNNISINSNLNILGKIINNLRNYDSNQAAINAGLIVGEWYRIGGVINMVVTPDLLILPFYVYNNYTTMIQYSYRQGRNYSIPPEFYTINNIYNWKWGSITSPITLNPSINGFGGSGQSWGLSSTFLNNVGFKYNESWCFVFRGIRIYKQEYFLNVNFDTSASTWNANGSGGQGDAPIGIGYNQNNSSASGGYNTILTQYSNDSFFDSEFYMILSYDKSILQIKAEIMDLNGNIKSAIIINNYTYSNNINPFHIYMNNDTYMYSQGMAFSKTYLNYNDFKSYFI